jgi:hypothetical protein
VVKFGKSAASAINIYIMFKLFRKIPKSTIVIIGIIFAIIVGVLDYFTGLIFPLVILYFLPLIIIIWYVNLRIGVLFSFVCVVLSAFTDMLAGSVYILNHVFIFNITKRLLVFLAFTIIVYTLKKNLELDAKNKLITQRSQAIIDTSQRTTGVIVESIAKHNYELLSWINKQKENGQHVPEIIEATHRNIGESLRALSEVSFGETVGDKELDIDSFIGLLHKRLKEAGNKIFSKSKK